MTALADAALVEGKDRGQRSATWVVAGVVLLVGLVAAAGLMWWNQRATEVWVHGIFGEGLWVEIPHNPVSVEGSRYILDTDLEWDELIAEVERKYPEGSEASDGTWAVAVDGTIFVLAPLADGQYVLQAQFVLASNTETGGVRVPFPAFELERDVITQGETLDVGWDLERWSEFYGLLGVSPAAGTFGVETSSEGSGSVVIDATRDEPIESTRSRGSATVVISDTGEASVELQ